jgi:cell division protease FtsH
VAVDDVRYRARPFRLVPGAGNEGAVVLAATNRPEILDEALLRPGRFDRRVTVSAPDQRGRRQILAVHTRGVPLAPSVDLDAVAAETPGMVGADLANLVNEAALLAARRNHERVTMADFTDFLAKVVLGTIRGIVLSPQERERTAYHESGHALLGMLTPGADPVRKISIIPAASPSAPPTRPLRPSGTTTPPPTCAAGSPAPWAAAPPRRSSTAT